MKKMKKRPVVLIILDGWGMNHHTEQVDAVRMAHPVNFERYRKEYPFTELRADGEFVGLPEGQFGNSEVGHLNIGAGRVVYQLLPKITKEIREGLILDNKPLSDVMNKTKENGKALHIMGLMSDGGVHSHINHIIGLVDMAKKKGLTEVYVHALMDGRDTPPESGAGYLEQMQKALDEAGVPQKVKDEELKVAIEKTREEQAAKGKNLPDAMLQQIAQGRLKKFYKENCLLEQEFIQDSKLSVAEYLHQTDKDLTVTAFRRFTLRAE